MAVLSSLSLLVFLILSPFCFFSFSGPTQINQVVSHPSQPLTITAHDDRGIRFLDNRTGESQPPQPSLTCAGGGEGSARLRWRPPRVHLGGLVSPLTPAPFQAGRRVEK